MLKERLLSKDFYLDSMSMFLKNSFGMIDREETYRAVLNNVNGIADSLISRYDLFNILFKEDYFERNGIDRNGDEDAVLDNIAAIFGLNRSMNVTYYGIGYADQYYGERGVLYTEPILLTNRELYIYIKIAITKLNFQGTAGEIKDLYYPTGEGDDDVKKLGIYYSWGGTPVQPTTGTPLVCNVWLCDIGEISKNNFNSNIIKLFLADELLVESLGIQYIKSLGMSTFVARFDVADIPDVEHYVYVFDPNFSNQAQDGFKYAVFQ